jgi:peroxiredoxin
MGELQGLGAQLSDAERRGIAIIAISPDSNAQSQQVAEGLRLHYRFVADGDLAVTRRYGLVHADGGGRGKDVPRPATVVLDREGVVRWLSVTRNVQVRPDPDDVLRALRSLSDRPRSGLPGRANLG